MRRFYNDVTFIDTFLTEEFCRDNKLFSFAYNDNSKRYEIESREFQQIKKRFLQSLTNMGQPIIEVVDANFQNRAELLLKHLFEETELDKNYSTETLRNLHSIWKRPVHIQTVMEDREVILTYDGDEIRQQWIGDN